MIGVEVVVHEIACYVRCKIYEIVGAPLPCRRQDFPCRHNLPQSPRSVHSQLSLHTLEPRSIVSLEHTASDGFTSRILFMSAHSGRSSSARLTSQLLSPPNTGQAPVIICFHGSGEAFSPSWDELTLQLSMTYSVFLPDRGSRPVTPADFVSKLSSLLVDIPPPYILIAHSYGGAFARCFLHARSKDVAGMVMVETGQEAAWDPEIEQRQYSRQVLGARPLGVIRGNSLIAKFKALDYVDAESEGSETQRKMLRAWDAEDERLKKAQLALSRNHRYTYLPDCGHHVIRDRPDVVVEEVRWVMQNLSGPKNTHNPGAVLSTVKLIWAKLRR